jgi:hypothetical protein
MFMPATQKMRNTGSLKRWHYSNAGSLKNGALVTLAPKKMALR